MIDQKHAVGQRKEHHTQGALKAAVEAEGLQIAVFQVRQVLVRAVFVQELFVFVRDQRLGVKAGFAQQALPFRQAQPVDVAGAVPRHPAPQTGGMAQAVVLAAAHEHVIVVAQVHAADERAARAQRAVDFLEHGLRVAEMLHAVAGPHHVHAAVRHGQAHPVKQPVVHATAVGRLGRVVIDDVGGDVRFGAFVAQDWGLHLIDVSLVMQDMVDLVPVQLAAWKAQGR